MMKQTVYIGSPAKLHTDHKQLVVTTFPEMPAGAAKDLRYGRGPEGTGGSLSRSLPIEDIGVVVLDHPQIVVSHTLINRLLAQNVALVTCDETHHPVGMMFSLSGHSLQAARFDAQLSAGLPLKKRLWQQTVRAKIGQQAALLEKTGGNAEPLRRWEKSVRSGDTGNLEARAAAYYWPALMERFAPGFTRLRGGPPPNNLLNYGYAVLRALVARALVSSGLLPAVGIFHRNQYNHYPLADDIMEPYRPFVDLLVVRYMAANHDLPQELGKAEKAHLLELPQLDLTINGENSPLMVAVTRTTASLSRCFEGDAKNILYPD